MLRFHLPNANGTAMVAESLKVVANGICIVPIFGTVSTLENEGIGFVVGFFVALHNLNYPHLAMVIVIKQRKTVRKAGW